MGDAPLPELPPDDAAERRLRAPAAQRQPLHLDGVDLADLFSGLPATIWTTDTKLVVTSVQGQLIRQWQVEPSRLLGRTLPDLLLDGREDHPFIQAHLAAIAGYDTPVRVEWGGMLYGVRIAPMRNEAGQIIGSVGVQQQMGWLPDDEDTLRESDVRLRRVIESSMVGIAFGDDEGRITDANDAFLQIVGCAREDVMADGLSWPALTPVEHQSAVIGAIGEILATGRCKPFEAEIIRRDGRRVSVLVGASRLSVRRREGVAFVLDITERKRNSQRLEAELAIADALAAPGPAVDVIAPVLVVLRDALQWKAAQWWTMDAEDALVLAAAEGTNEEIDAAVRPFVTDAIASGRPSWRPELQALAVPFTRDGAPPFGALVLMGRQDAADADLLAACERIAARIARRQLATNK